MDIFRTIEAELPELKSLQESYLSEYEAYETVYLYGAGQYGLLMAELMQNRGGVRRPVFVDSDEKKQGKEILPGILCISPEEIKNDSKRLILITVPERIGEICRRLPRDIECHVDTEWIHLLVRIQNMKNILDQEDHYRVLLEKLQDDQSREIIRKQLWNRVSGCYTMKNVMTSPEYFVEEIVESMSEGEIFLDGGAYDGDTVQTFQEVSGNRFEAIYSFEMDSENFKKLNNNPCVNDERVHTFPFGLGEKNEEVKYARRGNVASSYVKDVAEAYTDTALIKSLDEMIKMGELPKAPTMIKLDIEGAEMDALKGMRETLIKEGPILIVCIYHLPNDLWQIPLYLMDLLPDYDFFVRHHSRRLTDTVLYGIPKRGTLT